MKLIFLKFINNSTKITAYQYVKKNKKKPTRFTLVFSVF